MIDSSRSSSSHRFVGDGSNYSTHHINIPPWLLPIIPVIAQWYHPPTKESIVQSSQKLVLILKKVTQRYLPTSKSQSSQKLNHAMILFATDCYSSLGYTIPTSRTYITRFAWEQQGPSTSRITQDPLDNIISCCSWNLRKRRYQTPKVMMKSAVVVGLTTNLLISFRSSLNMIK